MIFLHLYCLLCIFMKIIITNGGRFEAGNIYELYDILKPMNYGR